MQDYEREVRVVSDLEKKIKELEKRVAELEERVPEQPLTVINNGSLEIRDYKNNLKYIREGEETIRIKKLK
ncbi:hypothetical protein [Orenia marismortui]|uniref:Uncharacterized protein n=1 Tax=Orenia marismortui TaxID=46469 RepID=A0A4R8GT31_9FIRM|nr:hypothetical protein [Orenia marismortui]TDX49135.1 hypothetical protein C7959_12029 [Orenia marismortui]